MKEVYLAESAVLVGDVKMEEGVSVWHNATLRADTAPIEIGKNTNIQDNACMHAGDGFPVRLGQEVTIGHGAIVHGCSVGDNTIVGMGAILLNGAKVGKNCLIGAGALITQGKEIPDGSLALGNPAKVVRMLTAEEIAHNKENALHYVKAAKEQLHEM